MTHQSAAVPARSLRAVHARNQVVRSGATPALGHLADSWNAHRAVLLWCIGLSALCLVLLLPAARLPEDIRFAGLLGAGQPGGDGRSHNDCRVTSRRWNLVSPEGCCGRSCLAYCGSQGRWASCWRASRPSSNPSRCMPWGLSTPMAASGLRGASGQGAHGRSGRPGGTRPTPTPAPRWDATPVAVGGDPLPTRTMHNAGCGALSVLGWPRCWAARSSPTCIAAGGYYSSPSSFSRLVSCFCFASKRPSSHHRTGCRRLLSMTHSVRRATPSTPSTTSVVPAP